MNSAAVSRHAPLSRLPKPRPRRNAAAVNPWLETALVILAALAGAAGGRAASRLPGRWWTAGYVPPLTVIVLFAVSVRRPDFALHPLVSWIYLGRWKYFVLGTVVAMVFATLIPKLPVRRDRWALGVLITMVVGYVGVWPCLAVTVSRSRLAALRTTLPPDGVCRQSTDYTCGPAAAVTALRRLGLPAEEGELALLARTSVATGTPPDVLARVLNERYGHEGLRAEFRRFHSVEELRGSDPVLVIVKFSLLLDHWLTITEVTDREVIAGDPLSGPVTLTHEEFARRWRRIGVVLRRTSPPR